MAAGHRHLEARTPPSLNAASLLALYNLGYRYVIFHETCPFLDTE